MYQLFAETLEILHLCAQVHKDAKLEALVDEDL